MGGRQAHGRSLTSQSKSKKGGKHSKARSQQNVLNAFGIAQEQFPTREKKTPRFRELDADIERKHGRDEDDDEDEEDEEEQPRRKRAKGRGPANDDDAEYGSDSEGNEWRLGGLAEDDEDSEIESDDAFGDSDDEKFDGYTFRGSKSAHNRDDDSEDDSNDDEGETLGEEAIDLATALDQWEEESDDVPEADGESGSESDSDESDESDDDEEFDDEDDHEADPEQLETLRGLVSGFGGDEDGDKDKTSTKQKIKIGDLGLSGLDDAFMKNSLKLMTKEQKEKRPGATKKLDVPLSRREQGRLDRSAAYEKTNETLDRWKDTVKHHWEAEHVSFPLVQNNNNVGLDTTEIQPLTAQNASNELESTILSIMDQSGLTMEKPKKEKEKVYDEDGNELTRKEIANRRRIERELQEREAKRAKRIKKIKSKAYHRVHRKQRERDEMAEHQARAEAGEIDSEEEREAQDRRRALERVGARHKESKWAKMGSKNKRAVWDDDFRAGLTEMARKDEELRRRVEGKRADSDDDTSSSGSDSEDDDAAIRRQLRELEAGFDEPQKGVMGMKFMRKAEEAKRQEIADLRKQFGDEDGNGGADDSAEEAGEVGRRQYGAASSAAAPALDTSNREPKKRRDADAEINGAGSAVPSSKASGPSNGTTNGNAWSATADAVAANATEGAWTSAAPRRKKGASSSKMEALDITSTVTVIPESGMAKSRKSASRKTAAPTDGTEGGGGDSDSDSETDQHLPLAIRDRELLEKAFAGDDVEAEFEREKDEVAEADDDKIVDNTLPGWGSWVGEGVSSREKKRHQGRFLTKVEGIKKKDRKDAKLDRVIINERRIKKNDRYLASQLPYPFESRAQYERSLRLPVGPEWQTKETFQDSTKPRVLLKQGVIAPISKPTR